MKYLAAILAALALFGVLIYAAQAQTAKPDPKPPIIRLRERVQNGTTWTTRNVWIGSETIVCVQPASGVHDGHTYVRVAGYHWQYVFIIEDPPAYVATSWAIATGRGVHNAP